MKVQNRVGMGQSGTEARIEKPWQCESLRTGKGGGKTGGGIKGDLYFTSLGLFFEMCNLTESQVWGKTVTQMIFKIPI